MTTAEKVLQAYLGTRTPNDVAKAVGARVAALVSDHTVKKTEVIRDRGFVHGRVYPIPQNDRNTR